jgi:hypothetical protein
MEHRHRQPLCLCQPLSLLLTVWQKELLLVVGEARRRTTWRKA